MKAGFLEKLIERLGLASDGGVLRIGLTHYNTAAEVDRLVEALARIAASQGSPGQRCHAIGNGGYELHRGCAGADHGDALAVQLEVVRP